MSDEMKLCHCGCGGEAIYGKWVRKVGVIAHAVGCKNCGIQTKPYPTEAEAVQAWNRAMGKRTVKVELNPLAEDIVIGNTTFKIGTRVIAECECGTWLRLGYKYCPNCGARLEWDDSKD